MRTGSQSTLHTRESKDHLPTRQQRWRFVPMLLTGSTVVSVVFALFLRSTPDAFPYGDLAVIETTTLAALRGFVTLGPYSQFGWHHPGPLCFYLLAPFYQLAGHRSIGMVAGALAINVTALILIGWAAARNGGRVVAVSVLAVIGLYLLRAGDLAASTLEPALSRRADDRPHRPRCRI